MAKVATNNISLQYAVEASVGVLPGSPMWRSLEPNDISAYGAAITTVARRPISRQRGRRKGTPTNLTSSVEYEADSTMDALSDFAEGFVFSQFANVEFDLKASSGTVPPPAVDGGGSEDSYTIDAASATLAGKIVYASGAARTLIYAKGYTNSANNGLKVVAADVAATNTAVQVATATLVAETPPTNASLQIAGVRIGDSDLTLTVSGSTATLVSAADVTNWATFGIHVGQFICVGSPNGSGGVVNALSDSVADDTYGYARVTSISGATLNLDKLSTTLVSSDNTGTGDCDILFGRFLRNVDVQADATDNRFLERFYQFELAYPDLGGVGTDEYEYAIGNLANEFTLNLPLTDKSTSTFNFVGTNTEDITGTRKSGASTAVQPLRTAPLNTSSNIVSLTTDVISSVSDVCFKSLTLTIGNGATPENCLGTFGASFINVGLFTVDLEGQMLFTNKEITNAVKNNTTVTFTAILSNEDGAFAIDLPSMTFGGGDKEYPVDQTVLVNLTGETFNDPTGTIPNVSLGISLFPVAI